MKRAWFISSVAAFFAGILFLSYAQSEPLPADKPSEQATEGNKENSKTEAESNADVLKKLKEKVRTPSLSQEDKGKSKTEAESNADVINRLKEKLDPPSRSQEDNGKSETEAESNADLLKKLMEEVRTPSRSQEEMEEKISKALVYVDKILANNPTDEDYEKVLPLKAAWTKDEKELESLRDELKAKGKDKLAQTLDRALLMKSLPKLFEKGDEAVQEKIAELNKEGKNELAVQIQENYMQFQLRAAFSKGPEEMKATLNKILTHYEEKGVKKENVRMVSSLGQIAEMVGDEEMLVDVYTRLQKLFKSSEDESIQKVAERFEGTLRRVKLLGNPIELKGKTITGEDLDMAKFKGKVVLVDFWATWCGPCVAEVPNMLKNYKAYNSKGFEIIGISLDRDAEPLKKFVEEKKIPWTIVYDIENNEQSPSIDYYGISAIPTMLLVDKEGKVISLRARGDELDKLLEKHLGKPEISDEEKGDKEEKSSESEEK